MPTYSTGELAKLAHISVRTLQYYDQRGLLSPTTLTAGGRRQYSTADQDRLELILFLKEMDLSLKAIGEILDSPNGNQVLALLLTQQTHQLTVQRDMTTAKLNRISRLQAQLPVTTATPLTTKRDIDMLMAQQQNLSQAHRQLLVGGLTLDALELAALGYGIWQHNWWPLGGALTVAVAGSIYLSRHYFQAVDYVCPNCQIIFKPHFKQAFWARHTTKARKLTCPNCHQTTFCVEIFKH